MAKGRKTGGRISGTPNKSTSDVKALARIHAPEAIVELARLARNAVSESARVGAIKEILDRAYGKAPQPMDGDGEGGPIQHVVQWLKSAE